MSLSASSPTVDLAGFGTRFVLGASATRGGVAVVEHTLAPGLLGAPLHRHQREDETSVVLAGRLSAQIGDGTHVVAPGQAVFKPRGEWHTFWNAGDEPVRFLEIITPGGFESYFPELAALLPPDGPPDLTALAALAARYGMEFDFACLPSLLAEHNLRLGA